MIKDKNVKTQLVDATIRLLNDKNEQTKLTENIATLAIDNADEVVAYFIMQSVEQ